MMETASSGEEAVPAQGSSTHELAASNLVQPSHQQPNFLPEATEATEATTEQAAEMGNASTDQDYLRRNYPETDSV
jgi:hypothetical protein